MARDAITTEGVPQAMRRLRALGEHASELTNVMETEARWAQKRTTGVPVDTGRLARSVAGGADADVQADPQGYSIGSKVPYARYVFGGTRHMEARPPKPPADAAQHAAEAISRELERPR